MRLISAFLNFGEEIKGDDRAISSIFDRTIMGLLTLAVAISGFSTDMARYF